MKYFRDLKPDLKDTIVFLDIDGTLTVDGSLELDAKTRKALELLKKHNEVYLCSNGVSPERNRKMGKACGVVYLDTPLRKPHADICKLIKNKGGKPLVVIGNLYYTDGRFAKNIGARFIKVKTLVGPTESWLARLFYYLDENIIARFV